ncbi:hypothetical protein F4809DRAFT_621873 [Biscogniauxia mediterranea]|nr:hypothetical protein F4809DRAFT_621873 [Biscogniauxia mediterranea]
MSAKQISPLLKAWYRWKSLRLPWRNRFLVGLDLQGNTYWEFRLRGADSSAAARHRLRRIVQYPRDAHYSDVRVPPQWHQWLRYRRDDAPTLAEQAADAARQARVRALAAEADARWAAKPSLLDMPQSQPPLGSSRRSGKQEEGQEEEEEGVVREERGDVEVEAKAKEQGQARREGAAPPPPEKEKEKKKDPWKQYQRGGPSETWQPAAWTPSAAPRRR